MPAAARPQTQPKRRPCITSARRAHGSDRLHIDLDPDDYDLEVTRISELGARPVDVGQGNARWTVFADPEGNEFCVLRPHTSLIE